VCSEPGQTLILTDVNALDDACQQWLMQRLNEPHGAETQVISLTSEPLFSLVEANRFDAALYYRLNTIHLKI
jgi:transcriptional regulator of acetoin/glycerol metabolism